MPAYNLNFISDNDIFEHVKTTVLKYRFAINLAQFNSNLIDPIKLTFDAKVYKKSLEAVIESEVIRQLDKSNTNHIGYFHQNIFNYLGGGAWVVPATGYDVVNEQQQIFVEMKNKHNTMNSSSSQKTYMRMQNTIIHNPAATCMLVEVIAANSQNTVWSISLDGQRVASERIRRVSIDKFYSIVTGQADAFKQLCLVLPKVIQDVVDSLPSTTASNTVLEELKKISPNLLKSIYLLSFSRYEGFNDFNVNNMIEADLLADITSVSKHTLAQWEKNGRVKPIYVNGVKKYQLESLVEFPEVNAMLNSQWEQEAAIKPLRTYQSIELFAGAGGLAIGLEQAGFHAVALNELDKAACQTLRLNRPHWNVLEGDIQSIDFKEYQNIDFVSGGFPCQAFSYAGKQLGFEDTRGTLFFEFARVIKETQPKVFLGENVRGLLEHDEGRTLATIKQVIQNLGYTLIEPRVLKAIFYRVPQKRERLMLVGIRNDLVAKAEFAWPSPYKKIMTLRDALQAGDLYPVDVPVSQGQKYPTRKAEVLSLVPQGGYWRDLPDAIQREYMQGSYFLGGGKTGMARRLAWDAPSLTLTCSPAQKQTERCHPAESRPLTVREYARIQTFPDDWQFAGSLTNQYKQIGNAVPVNLAFAIGRSLIALLNSLEHNN